jgi:glucose-6-phosphate dehydrogenase assembly protein OpcA
MEAAAVLRGIAGQDPLVPATRRLLATGHTSGADLAWGLLLGCRSALALSAAHPPRRGSGT